MWVLSELGGIDNLDKYAAVRIKTAGEDKTNIVAVDINEEMLELTRPKDPAETDAQFAVIVALLGAVDIGSEDRPFPLKISGVAVGFDNENAIFVGITEQDKKDWALSYPDVDIEAAIRQAAIAYHTTLSLQDRNPRIVIEGFMDRYQAEVEGEQEEAEKILKEGEGRCKHEGCSLPGTSGEPDDLMCQWHDHCRQEEALNADDQDLFDDWWSFGGHAHYPAGSNAAVTWDKMKALK